MATATTTHQPRYGQTLETIDPQRLAVAIGPGAMNTPTRSGS